MSTVNNRQATNQSHGSVEKLEKGIYKLQIPLMEDKNAPIKHVNIYLIEGSAGWTMIDSAWYSPAIQAEVESNLNSLGLSFSDIKMMIITHSHPDHVGMAGRIKHLSPKMELLMSEREVDLIESRYIRFTEPQARMTQLLENHGAAPALLDELETAYMPALEFITITLPDRVLYSGDIIHTGVYDLEIIQTPGHSPGHICLYEASHGFLFSGDHVLSGITSNISYHIQSGDNPLGDYLHSLQKISRLAVSRIFPGHLHPFTNLAERIKDISEHHRQREDKFQCLFGREPVSACEIASRMKWDVPGLTWDEYPPMLKRMAFTETIAHMEHMRWEGRLRKVVKGNSIYYSPA